MSVRQEKPKVRLLALLVPPSPELRPHGGRKAVPHELIPFQRTRFDPLLQSDTFAQTARLPAVIVRAALTSHILRSVVKWTAVRPAAARFLPGLGRHHLLHRLQWRIPHKIARHNRLLSLKTKEAESH